MVSLAVGLLDQQMNEFYVPVGEEYQPEANSELTVKYQDIVYPKVSTHREP